MAKYDEVETLLQAGEYQPGQDPDADLAIASIGRIRDFLAQPTTTLMPYKKTISMLHELIT